jgi:hypothetical protein
MSVLKVESSNRPDWGGVRLTYHNKKLYYEVADIKQKLSQSVLVSTVEPGLPLFLAFSHDKRLFGK